MSFTIRWTNFAQNSYSFGSQLSFVGKRVHFCNPLMTPGQTLTKWSSRTHFQKDRLHPSLPLLRGKQEYNLQLRANVQPQGTLYVQITFYDRFDREMGRILLKDQQWGFTYPEQAFFYTIELINAGCDTVIFDSLILSEESAEVLDVRLDDLAVYAPAAHNYLHVLFLEEDIEAISQLPISLLEKMGNVVLVGDFHSRASGYLSSDFEEKLKKHLHFYHENGLTQVRFIGYGPLGNVAAVYYSSKWLSHAYITHTFPSLSSYQKSLAELPDLDIEKIWERRVYSQTISYYGSKPHLENAFFASLLVDLQDLADLPFLQ